MRLSKITLMALKGNPEFRKKLAENLRVTDRTINRYILNNDDSLTKASALQLIREETGLEDNQILELETIGVEK